jgi:Zn-dependent M28 family amino/carboxypeptidase
MFLPLSLPAQIERRAIEASLSFLASDALEGREAGRRGGLIAAEYIRAELKQIGIKPLYNGYFQSFEAYAGAEKRGIEAPKTYYVHPDSIAKYKSERFYHRINLQNVIGIIEGEKNDEFIVAGAHYDHVGVDETLVGDQIYNGADDNAASVAALLEIARVFVAKGIKPHRSIIFAFWDGEEVNYLGSEYFATNFQLQNAIKAYINFDMIGREGLMPIVYPDFAIPEATAENTVSGNEFHLLYSPELTSASQKLLDDIKDLNIKAKTGVLGHPSSGSDFLSFSLRKIPFIWFFTGLHPDYHTPDDEIETVDLEKVTEIAKAAYLLIKQLAEEK